MTRWRVAPEAQRFLDALGLTVSAATELAWAIERGELASIPNPVGADWIELDTSDAGVRGVLQAGLGGLIAVGGLERDAPLATRFRIGNLSTARQRLERVRLAAALSGPGEVILHLEPELEDVAADVMRAACSGEFTAVQSEIRAGGPCMLPGLEALDSQQRAAVDAPPDADLLINAAAGSGKTHTLSFRIAHLVSEEGVAPDQAVVLTFSRAARRQIGQRLQTLAVSGYPQLQQIAVRTLHSYAREILVIAAGLRATRLRPGFVITDDARHTPAKGAPLHVPEPFIEHYAGIFADIADGLSDGERLSMYPAAINALRNGHPSCGLVLRPEELSEAQPITVISRRNGQLRELEPRHVKAVWERYAARLASANLIDRAGLPAEALQVLNSHPRILSIISSASRLMFVDEYQDTTVVQNELLFLLAGTGVRLNVVGDGDQTVTSFAGADVSNITGFVDRLWAQTGRVAVVVPLETNYRSRPEIVGVAAAVISNNAERLPKIMRPADLSAPAEGHVFRTAGELRYLAPWIARRIVDLITLEGVAPSQIAVAYRKEAENSPQGSSVADHLRSQGIAATEDEEELAAVRVVTIHRAKGLEFDHVFVLFLGKGHFPDPRGNVEEERRLLYVALTRARLTLYICGQSGGEPDFFTETDREVAMATSQEVNSIIGEIDPSVMRELREELDASQLDDWDDPI